MVPVDDSTSNLNEYVWPGAIGWDVNTPVSETTECGFVSSFLQVTVSPGRTLTFTGWKPVDVIETLAVAPCEELFAVAAEATTASASVASTRINAFRMVE